jgi:hypothetical protein
MPTPKESICHAMERVKWVMEREEAKKILVALYKGKAVRSDRRMTLTAIAEETGIDKSIIYRLIVGSKKHRAILKGFVHYPDKGKRKGYYLLPAGRTLAKALAEGKTITTTLQRKVATLLLQRVASHHQVATKLPPSCQQVAAKLPLSCRFPNTLVPLNPIYPESLFPSFGNRKLENGKEGQTDNDQRTPIGLTESFTVSPLAERTETERTPIGLTENDADRPLAERENTLRPATGLSGNQREGTSYRWAFAGEQLSRRKTCARCLKETALLTEFRFTVREELKPLIPNAMAFAGEWLCDACRDQLMQEVRSGWRALMERMSGSDETKGLQPSGSNGKRTKDLLP